MSVKVNIPGFMPDMGALEVSGATVGECLENAVKRQPAFKTAVFDESGKPRSENLVIINGHAVYTAPAATPVKDGDFIRLVAAAGG